MIGIIGKKTVTKTGSLAGKHIPSLHILVEDELAQIVVDCIYEHSEYIAKKYILSGAWANQASCLYGFLTYGMELESLQIPSFGIVAITDGDIPLQSIEKRVKEVIKGNYKNPAQEKIVERIADSITSFDLEFRPEDTNGLPEYNHKRWFEEITEEKVLAIHKETKKNFVHGTHELSSLFELIDFSKSVLDDHPSIKNTKGKPDYHKYYTIIKDDFRSSNTSHKMNNLPWYILNCIKYYNNEKWIYYTKNAREKIDSSYSNHRKKILESHFDFR